jgi:glycosyltransferase involved in cell wall biosynthesis
MMSNPKVSIGMPVYNGEEFIREALDSLLAQTFTDFELIISDNSSKDNTEAICRDYAAKDERIRYILQPENRGPVANFRFVLDQARGEYFMWAAADDKWDKNWVEVLLSISEKNNCVAFGTFQVIDQESKNQLNIGNNRNLDYSGTILKRRISYYLSPTALGRAMPIYGLFPRKFISTEIFSSTLGRDFRFKDGSYRCDGTDELFVFSVLRVSEIKTTQNTKMYKRVSKTATSIMPSLYLSLWEKIWWISIGGLRSVHVNYFLEGSQGIEYLLFLLLFPIACFRSYFAIFSALILKIRREM